MRVWVSSTKKTVRIEYREEGCVEKWKVIVDGEGPYQEIGYKSTDCKEGQSQVQSERGTQDRTGGIKFDVRSREGVGREG